ncbi:nucleotidyltransferase family protein [Candidatus Methylacidithermus pantelleriae]|nr:nucleotidyltransferase family protein [Candidatus Methylacidithermus pantelleriae]
MKAIILAAGYGTRLAPLTDCCPKALLPVGGRPILEYILDSLVATDGIEEACVVSNAKFYPSFLQWAATWKTQASLPFALHILNDGTTSDATRRGAIGDLWFALTDRGWNQDEILVVAGDNLFRSSLSPMVQLGRDRRAPVVAVYRVPELASVRLYNHLRTDREGRIVFFEEKPDSPQDTRVAVGLYYFPPELPQWLKDYLCQTDNRDQPGRFIQWLFPKVPVYVWELPGLWFDIGSRQALEEADQAVRSVGVSKA